MMDDVLVDRCAGGDEDRHARALPPSSPPELLPRPRDGARVAGQDRDVQPADVDPELEGIRRDHAENLTGAKAAFDGAPSRRQGAARLARDPRARSVALPSRLARAR